LYSNNQSFNSYHNIKKRCLVLQILLKAIEKHRHSFLSLPGVVSIGLGFKIIRNFNTGVPSLTFGVKKKLPLYSLPADQVIPRLIDHLPTDIVEVGKVKFMGYALPQPEYPPGGQVDFRKSRVRPAQPGVSIGHFRATAGTFGALVRGDFPGGTAILSNNHIIANGTDGHDGLAGPGDPVLQPGPYDNGGPEDIIARLYSFSPLIPENRGGKHHFNTIDAALAIPVDPADVVSPVLGLGHVKNISPAMPGMMVFKSGRSSSVTRGIISTAATTIRVESDDKNYIFEGQIGIASKSEPGDSGSLVVSQFGRAVGLLFAGSERYSFANPVGNVLDFFRVSLFY
jgi:hypothetical protein